MASQLAQVLSNYRQTMPEAGSGIKQGVGNFFAMQATGKDSKQTELMDIKTESAKIDLFKQKFGGAIASADTQDKWNSAMNSGFIPKGMEFSNREPFVMGMLQEKAFKTKEVGDPESPTGSTFVREFESAGKPGKPKGKGASMVTVKSSKILPGGLVQMVMSDGTVNTVPPDQADEMLIVEAEERGAQLQGLRANRRTGGKGAADIGLEAFESTGKIRVNIANLKSVIKLVGEGAETGPISKRFPDFRAASVKLRNMQSRLGLDVVGSVRFGALSKGELDLALDVALPTGLQGPELVKWANEKISSQEKLAKYFESQADFLLDGGTVPNWLRSQKAAIQETQGSGAQGRVPPTNAQGWNLMEDAQGNQAYVGPNGEIEEVQ